MVTVTSTAMQAGPAGEFAVICVGESKVKLAAGVPPKSTDSRL